MTTGSKSQGSTGPARRSLRGWVAGCLGALAAPVALAFLPAASAATVAAGFKALPAATTLAEPAASRGSNFRPVKVPAVKKTPRRQPPKKATFSPKPSPDRPDRPRNPDRPDKPHRPPILVVPTTPGELSEYVASLPKRAERRASQAQTAPPRVARQILVLVDDSQPQSLGGQLAQAYGLELLSSRPIGLIGA